MCLISDLDIALSYYNFSIRKEYKNNKCSYFRVVVLLLVLLVVIVVVEVVTSTYQKLG